MSDLPDTHPAMFRPPRLASFPVIADPALFDRQSGSWLERAVFNHRPLIVALLALATALLGWMAVGMQVHASFSQAIPSTHPYVRNYLDRQDELRGLGNRLQVIVENRRGDVFDPAYLQALARVNDALYLTPGVDRPWLRSLWTPLVRWSEVTEEGWKGGPVMPNPFEGSPEQLHELRRNVDRAGLVGSLVAADRGSSAVVVPLLDRYSESGLPLDYLALSRTLEQQVRSQQDHDAPVRIRIVGFAKLMGDLIEGLGLMSRYFALSVLVVCVLVFAFVRCLRSTLLLVVASLLAVAWMLGLSRLCGLAINPYSMLVPFLVFAMGMSHGAQKLNGVLQDVGRGSCRYAAARHTFRRLFGTGVVALLANAIGFAVLGMVEVPALREMAAMACLGVAALVCTTLILIPLLLSYVGVSAAGVRHALRSQGRDSVRGGLVCGGWRSLQRLARPRQRRVVFAVAGLLAAGLALLAARLQVGDLDRGASELRADATYNLDAAYAATHYAWTSDPFAVIVETPAGQCDSHATLVESERLATELRQLPGVVAVSSLADHVRHAVAASHEGHFKWSTLPRDDRVRGYASARVFENNPDTLRPDCRAVPVVAHLADHRAATLERVLLTVESFARAHDSAQLRFLPAAGSAGIEAVTNRVVGRAGVAIHAALYTAVAVLCLATFRSWRVTAAVLVPLALTSLFAAAFMATSGLGIKLATLPVLALGIGVGVDYGLYLMTILIHEWRTGVSVEQAGGVALRFTGKAVALVGTTMAAGVGPWLASPIKFQADMGLLMMAMFLCSVVCALVMTPALAGWILQRGVRHPASASAPGA